MKKSNFSIDDLSTFRENLDKIDESLIKLLAKRFRITFQVGLLKKELRLEAIDKAREDAQFNKIEKLAEKNQLDPIFAKKILRLIIDEVVKNHKKLNKNGS